MNILMILLWVIISASAFFIGKCDGYRDGYIEGRLEEKFRSRK